MGHLGVLHPGGDVFYRVLTQLSLKCVLICYSGIFGVVEPKYNAQDDLQCTWGALHPGTDVIYGNYVPIALEMR